MKPIFTRKSFYYMFHLKISILLMIDKRKKFYFKEIIFDRAHLLTHSVNPISEEGIQLGKHVIFQVSFCFNSLGPYSRTKRGRYGYFFVWLIGFTEEALRDPNGHPMG